MKAYRQMPDELLVNTLCYILHTGLSYPTVLNHCTGKNIPRGGRWRKRILKLIRKGLCHATQYKRQVRSHRYIVEVDVPAGMSNSISSMGPRPSRACWSRELTADGYPDRCASRSFNGQPSAQSGYWRSAVSESDRLICAYVQNLVKPYLGISNSIGRNHGNVRQWIWTIRVVLHVNVQRHTSTWRRPLVANTQRKFKAVTGCDVEIWLQSCNSDWAALVFQGLEICVMVDDADHHHESIQGLAGGTATSLVPSNKCICTWK